MPRRKKPKKPTKEYYELDLPWLQATGEEKWVRSDSPTAVYYGWRPATKMGWWRVKANESLKRLDRRAK